MGFGSIGHWVILLIIVLLVFGTKKLKNLGGDLGGAIKGFKDGMRDGEKPAEPAPPAAQVTAERTHDSQTIDVQAKTKN